MGNRPIGDCGLAKENCAESGAPDRDYCMTKDTLRLAINDVLNFLRIERMKYGSDKWIGRDFAVLRRLIDDRFYDYTSKHIYEMTPGVCDGELREIWSQCRKYGYRELRDQEVIVEPERPLIPGTPSRGGVVYVYAGQLATHNKRFVKIGFTSKNLEEYLESLRRQYDPWFLAKRPGNIPLERSYQKRWNIYLADGDEWFYARSDLLDWVKASFAIVNPDFDQLVQKLIQQP